MRLFRHLFGWRSRAPAPEPVEVVPVVEPFAAAPPSETDLKFEAAMMQADSAIDAQRAAGEGLKDATEVQRGLREHLRRVDSFFAGAIKATTARHS